MVVPSDLAALVMRIIPRREFSVEKLRNDAGVFADSAPCRATVVPEGEPDAILANGTFHR